MKKMLYIFILNIVVGISLVACDTDVPSYSSVAERCADLPVALTASAHFVINNQAYVFGGRTASDTYSNRLYSYDPNTDQWKDLGETPLKARVRPRAITVGNAVYLGLGMNGHVLIDSAYLRDWWKYTPSTNKWKRLADYPTDRTVGPVIMADEQYIYLAYGGRQNFERWIFRYDIAADKWVKLADGIERMATYPPRAHSAAGTTCGERYFLGAGFFVKSQDFWVEVTFDQDSIIWQKRSPLPNKRHNTIAISDNNNIYLAGGNHYGGTVTTGMLYDDILCYTPTHDKWDYLCHLPDGGRENMVAWIIHNTLYVGLGSDKYNRPCQQLYRIAL